MKEKEDLTKQHIREIEEVRLSHEQELFMLRRLKRKWVTFKIHHQARHPVLRALLRLAWKKWPTSNLRIYYFYLLLHHLPRHHCKVELALESVDEFAVHVRIDAWLVLYYSVRGLESRLQELSTLERKFLIVVSASVSTYLQIPTPRVSLGHILKSIRTMNLVHCDRSDRVMTWIGFPPFFIFNY